MWSLINLIVLIVVILICIVVVLSGNDVKFGELPDCGQREIIKSKRLVFVSTLDGTVSALNIDNGGSKEWSVATGPGQMISSSIHKLELTNHGQLIRMIPSLNGGLYTFDGESIRPIPINADKLLQSSFRYSDELVISGGKESRTYGVDPHTGQVLYECSVSKCDNLTPANEAVKDVILIQRQTQTVRAVEPRSGIERWNFSVGQHNMKVVEDPAADCHDATSSDKGPDIILKVIVPDGLICAVSKTKPSKVIWQHKFDYPVVSAWQMVEGQLHWVDLLGGAATPPLPYSPLLYVGMHNKQLYIQESVVLQKKYLDIMAASNASPPRPQALLPSIPWKPIPASKTLGIPGSSDPILQITDETSPLTTALSVLYASEYVNGNGFFLYGTEDKASCPQEKINISVINETDEEGAFISFEEYDDENTHKVEFIIQHINHSIWHWWKEIILITIPTAFLINILCFKKYSVWNKVEEVIVKGEIEEGVCEPAVEEEQPVEPTLCYNSRYLTDFEPVSCLGRGGFSVVFQARNMIDDCHYAIKRIPLPNREESRERVMREVKALAKLDHQNIVRFFNAWLECPPPQWQEDQDTHWANKFQRDLNSESGAVVDLTGHVTPISEIKSFAAGGDKKKNILSSLWDKATSFYSSIHKLEKSFESEPRCITSEDDSFIVFENSNKEAATTLNSTTEQSVISRPKTLSLTTNHNDSRRRSGHTSDVSHGPSSAKMFLYIQMQLCKRESLRHWLLNSRRDHSRSLQLFDQIVQAVEYVHMQGLIHRDLKPSNIFFSPEGQIKVGDFGLVTAMVENCSDNVFFTPTRYQQCTVGERHTAMVGTQLYMSPEQLVGEHYNYKVDIYSLGLILYELLVPFTTQMERCESLTKVRALEFPEKFTQDFKNEHNLLEIMLSRNPENRPTTIGIRSRPPLLSLQAENTISDDWHFELPIRHRDPSFSKSSSSHDS